MIYNFEFTLKEGEPVDVTGITPNNRVVYFADRNSYMFCKSPSFAQKQGGEVLSKMQASGRYPDKFFVKSRKAKNSTSTSIILPPGMYNFCRRKGIIGDYIRSLIQREMDKEGFRP